MASWQEVFHQGNEAFVDGDDEAALASYTRALELATVDADVARVLVKRAVCRSRMAVRDDALVLADLERAASLDAHNAAVHLRLGTVLFECGRFADAKEALLRAEALLIDSGDSADAVKTRRWLRKCDVELGQGAPVEKIDAGVEKVAGETAEEAAARAVAAAKAKRPAYEWYQTGEDVHVGVFVRNATEDRLKVEISERNLTVHVQQEPESAGAFVVDIDLLESVDPAASSFQVTPLRVNVRLRKTQAINWPALEADVAPPVANVPAATGSIPPSAAFKPSYPSSSRHKKDWSQVDRDIEEDLKEDDGTGEDGLTKLLKQIYSKGDPEVMMAMNKSFTESGGTVLSTNWSEIGKGKVEGQPPKGMVARKWDK